MLHNFLLDTKGIYKRTKINEILYDTFKLRKINNF